MKLTVVSSYPEEAWGTFAANWLRESARLDPHGKHSIIEDPASADAILFMEGHPGSHVFMERVFWHPLRRKYREKSFLYHDCDYAFPLMPGVYPSIRVPHHRAGLSAGGLYLARIEENKAVTQARGLQVKQDLLYSFVGANNCAVRERILRAGVPDTQVVDTTGRRAWMLSAEERAGYEAEYVEICARSRFILAPRGLGPSTYRLFEAMELGRCPVILSDDWVPPPFIPWESFSLRIPESQVGDLPRILADKPHEELGRAARRAWEQFVDKPHAFHYLAETMQLLLDEKKQAPVRRAPYLDLMASDMRGFYLKHKMRGLKRRLRALVPGKAGR